MRCCRATTSITPVVWLAVAVAVFAVVRWVVSTVSAFAVSVGVLLAEVWSFMVTVFGLAVTVVGWLAITAVAAGIAYVAVRAVMALPTRRCRWLPADDMKGVLNGILRVLEARLFAGRTSVRSSPPLGQLESRCGRRDQTGSLPALRPAEPVTSRTAVEVVEVRELEVTG